MLFTLTYPAPGLGRGAFPTSGAGGTLDAAGLKPGPYYRAPAAGASKPLPMPGLTAFLARRDQAPCSINDYAVWRTVQCLQTELAGLGGGVQYGENADGIFGPKTTILVTSWQTTMGLKADGVFGPASAKRLLTPLVNNAADSTGAPLAHTKDVAVIMRGTVAIEAGWDSGAIGRPDPHDIGLAQVNIPSHPSMTVDTALMPREALFFMATLVSSNLQTFSYNVRDAVASYNLGKGGARSWIRAGRPDIWTPVGSTEPRDVRRYIDRILAAGA